MSRAKGKLFDFSSLKQCAGLILDGTASTPMNPRGDDAVFKRSGHICVDIRPLIVAMTQSIYVNRTCCPYSRRALQCVAVYIRHFGQSKIV